MRSITRAHVGYDYMNSRFIHDQTFTGYSSSIMGCTQDLQDLQDDARIKPSLFCSFGILFILFILSISFRK